jgi:hypothetical protein
MARSVRRLIALGIAAAAVALPIGAAAAPLGGLVESNYERTHHRLNRDCGFSQPLPGRPGLNIWLFCDTVLPNGLLATGGTAAVGPFTRGSGTAQTDLTEVPSPPAPIGHLPSNRPPEPFLKVPTDLAQPNGGACSVPREFFPARWMTGVAQEPAAVGGSKLLISFIDVCEDRTSFTIEHFGLAEYEPAINTVTSVTRVFSEGRRGRGLLPRLAFGSPIFIGGNLFLFSSVCTPSGFGTCTRGAVFLARVPANRQSWQRSRSYRFFDSTARGDFTSDPLRARSLISDARPVVAVTANDYPQRHGLALIEETTLGGAFRVWTAGQPIGPWSSRTDSVPCSGGSGLDGCRALIGHPELSTPSVLRLSYFNPSGNHVRLTQTSF